MNVDQLSCQLLLESIDDYTWVDVYELCSLVQVARVLCCPCCNRRIFCFLGHEEAVESNSGCMSSLPAVGCSVLLRRPKR